jgi:hypothetical protein
MTCAHLKSLGIAGPCLECMLEIQSGLRTFPRNQAELDHLNAAEKARLDRVHDVITDIRELSGWEIMEILRHKPGVVRWAAERDGVVLGGRVRREGYAKDEVFARLQIQPPL